MQEAIAKGVIKGFGGSERSGKSLGKGIGHDRPIKLKEVVSKAKVSRRPVGLVPVPVKKTSPVIARKGKTLFGAGGGSLGGISGGSGSLGGNGGYGGYNEGYYDGYNGGYDEHPDPFYFKYGVHDDKYYTDFTEERSGDEAGNIKGAYSVALPDGRLQDVVYHADGNYGGTVMDVSYKGEARHPDSGHY